MLKKIRSIFNENTDQFYVLKKIKSVFNENTDQFYVLKKIKFVFNENTDQFYVLKIKSEKFKSVFSLKRSLTISRI